MICIILELNCSVIYLPVMKPKVESEQKDAWGSTQEEIETLSFPCENPESLLCDVFPEVAYFETIPAGSEVKLGKDSIMKPLIRISEKSNNHMTRHFGMRDDELQKTSWVLITYDVKPYIKKVHESKLLKEHNQTDLKLRKLESKEYVQYDPDFELINIRELYLSCSIINREPGVLKKRVFYHYVKEKDAAATVQDEEEKNMDNSPKSYNRPRNSNTVIFQTQATVDGNLFF